MAGRFFCLASAEGAGLLFLPCYNTAAYKRLQRVLCRPCQFAANATKQRTGLYRRFSCDLPHSTAADTRPTQTDITPPATRWSISQHRSTSSTYQIPEPRRTLYRPAQTAYYNNVYKDSGAPLSWIHASRCSISQTMPARRGQLLPSVDRWQVLHPAGQSSSRGGAGGAEPLAATAVSLFGLSPDS